jgi:hypothetical protein
LDDIEHVVINIHVIELQASMEFFIFMGWESVHYIITLRDFWWWKWLWIIVQMAKKYIE